MSKLDLTKNENTNSESIKNIEILLDKIKKISKNEQQINYIYLAIESLTNKTARIKLKNLIDGMNLVG